MTQQEFNELWWASQPPQVQALRGTSGYDDRQAQAIELATKGFKIDPNVCYYGLDPYASMRLLADYGYKWIPSLLMPAAAPVNPITMDSDQFHLALMPRGAIKVSLDQADYPAFTPQEKPKPKPPAWDITPGKLLIPTKCAVSPGDDRPVGFTWTGKDGSIWVKQIVVGPFGNWAWWELKQ